MERCLQKQMKAENWKWAEGKQTSFVFCCLVASTLYQLLEGFMNCVCECSSLRIPRRSLFWLVRFGLYFVEVCGQHSLIIQYDFNNLQIWAFNYLRLWFSACLALVTGLIYVSVFSFFISSSSSSGPWKSFFFIIVPFWMSWSKYASSLILLHCNKSNSNFCLTSV